MTEAFDVTRRIGGGLAALGLLAGLTAGAALAQQKPAAQPTPPGQPPAAAPAKPAAGAPAAAAPAAGGPAQPAGAQTQSAWVKLCEKANLKRQEKEETIDICLTHHERLDGNTGMVIVSAAVREVGGNPKKHLMVMVPLGVALPAGLQVKIDEEKEPIKLVYTLCHPGGCTAEVEATDDMIGKLKKGKQMVVAAMNVAAKPIFLPVPLNGFDSTLAGKPVDPKVYGEARSNLMKQIYQRQEELIKQAEEDAKKGGQPAAAAQPATTGAVPAAATAAKPAAAPPKKQ